MEAEDPVTLLRGVGPKVAERLRRLSISTIGDLLFHLPLRHQDRTRITPIDQLVIGEDRLIEGVIESARIQSGRRRSLLITVRDPSGTLILRLFHFNKGQQSALHPGVRLRCFGEVRYGPHTLEMIHPEYRTFSIDNPPPLEQALTPIYPATEGVQQRTLQRLITTALQQVAEQVQELIPPELLPASARIPLQQALHGLHQPERDTTLEQLQYFRQRLALEELLAHHLAMLMTRRERQHHHAQPLDSTDKIVEPFIRGLPFPLTTAQQRVIAEITTDLQRSYPMQRLLQGDVGSGKTLVALCAVLHAISAGSQVALMVPTELLARQHYHNIRRLLSDYPINTGLLSSAIPKKERQQLRQQLADGTLQLVIGTHALFQRDIHFHRLDLMIIDEQHRFGVEQRLALQQKKGEGNIRPHQLIMTATPIPRTLAMTFYADLDSSVIDELPPGRTPIQTATIPESRRREVIERVHANCLQGRQAYWVCPLIEESEAVQCQAATDHAEYLRQLLPDLTIGLVHGRMSASDKESEMERFLRGESNILVATTVIEVGVDVPNASLMIIENAERLGLSQLHQLRGRVGRGRAASSCVLLYSTPLGTVARERLHTIRDSLDGFEIARKDLEIRGPGELLGRRQTGTLQLRIADLSRDQALLPEVEAVGPKLISHHPESVTALIQRWIPQGGRFHTV